MVSRHSGHSSTWKKQAYRHHHIIAIPLPVHRHYTELSHYHIEGIRIPAHYPQPLLDFDQKPKGHKFLVRITYNPLHLYQLHTNPKAIELIVRSITPPLASKHNLPNAIPSPSTTKFQQQYYIEKTDFPPNSKVTQRK
jgi:hypothetical protein